MIRTPCGAHRLAGESGNLTGCVLQLAESRRVDRHTLRCHLASNERREPSRLTFQSHIWPLARRLAESGCARCPRRFRRRPASNGRRRPGRFTLHNWRMADHSKATPCGANRFPADARDLARSPSVGGAKGGIRTHHATRTPVPKTGASAVPPLSQSSIRCGRWESNPVVSAF